jgi:hypothetical protein
MTTKKEQNLTSARPNLNYKGNINLCHEINQNFMVNINLCRESATTKREGKNELPQIKSLI